MRGTVSLCFEHRDEMERSNESQSIENTDSDESIEEYDVGANRNEQGRNVEEEAIEVEVLASAENGDDIPEDPVNNDNEGAAMVEQPPNENVNPEFEYVEFLEVELLKDEPIDRSFNLETVRESLEGDITNESESSDCAVTAVYYLYDCDDTDAV